MKKRKVTIDPEAAARFAQFSIEHKRTGDIDPVYPVLRKVQGLRELSMVDSIWHTLIYLAWYHLGSAEQVFQRYPKPAVIREPIVGLKTGIERRGMRGNNKAVEMLNYLVETRSPLDQWLNDMIHAVTYEICDGVIEQTRWDLVYLDLMETRHNGTWAAFKWCDLVKNVLGYPISSPDIGLGGKGKNAGPVPGLARLTGLSWKECANDVELQRTVYAHFLALGVPWEGMEEFETALCDFNSVIKGRYYVGHDLDKQMEDFRDLPESSQEIYWRARELSFPHSALGEAGYKWNGVRKYLKGVL